MTEQKYVSVDPDDAVPGRPTLEDALCNFQYPPDSPPHSIKPCYYLLPRSFSLLSNKLCLPIGKLASCAMKFGIDEIRAKCGRELACIVEARCDVASNGGVWYEKEILFSTLRVDFESSKILKQWSVRIPDSIVCEVDSVSLSCGIHTGHMRQICMLGGLMSAVSLPQASRDKIFRVVRGFVGILREKGEACRHIMQKRSEPAVENPPNFDVDLWDRL